MSSINARVPLIGLQNRKRNENSNVNIKTESKINGGYDDHLKINSNPHFLNKHKNLIDMDHEKKEMNNKNNLNNNIKLDENILQQNKLFVSNEDDKTANDEYNKCVVKALKEAIDENEMLREKMQLIIQENSDLKKENKEKTEALVELAEYYEFCKKNHKNSGNCTCKTKRTSSGENNLNKKRRKSNSL